MALRLQLCPNYPSLTTHHPFSFLKIQTKVGKILSAESARERIHSKATFCTRKCARNSNLLKDIQPWLGLLLIQLLTHRAGPVRQSYKSTDSSPPEINRLSSLFKNPYAFSGQESKENTLWEEEMGIAVNSLIKNQWQKLPIFRFQGLPGGPMAKTPHSSCWRSRFSLWSGN